MDYIANKDETDLYAEIKEVAIKNWLIQIQTHYILINVNIDGAKQ